MLNYAQNNVHSNKLWEGNFFIQEKLNVKNNYYFYVILAWPICIELL